MLKIFYTTSENLDQETRMVIDESLIQSVEAENDPEGVEVISRWDLDEWNEMQVRSANIARQELEDAIQEYLDDTAKENGYDSIISMCTYVVSSNTKFKTDGEKAVALRDGCWEVAINILTDVQSGVRSIPTKEELISELPTL